MKLTDKQKIGLLRVFSPRPLQSLVDDEAFFVSVAEIQKIHLAVRTNENALLIGERGSGKTSLLNHLVYEYTNSKKDSQTVPVQLNLLQIENFTQTTFLEKLVSNIFDSVIKFRTKGEKIRHTLEKLGFVIPPDENMKSFSITLEGNVSYGRKEVDYEFLVERLEKVVHTLQERNIQIFVIIDDVDKINSKLIWNVFRVLRDTLWDLRVSLIMSVLPEQVSEITKPPLDQFFMYRIKMKPYDQMKARELIAKRAKFAKQRLELEEGALARLVTDTKGNPRSLMSEMKRILESAKETSKITEAMMAEIESSYLPELSSIERSVINYLVHNPHVSASSEDFSRSLGVTRSRLSQILNELREKGLIQSTKEGRRTKYHITVKGGRSRDKKEPSLKHEI